MLTKKEHLKRDKGGGGGGGEIRCYLVSNWILMSCQPHKVTSGQLNSGHTVRLICVPKTGNTAQSNRQYLLYLKNDQEASTATLKELLENNMTREVNPWNDCQLLSTELNQGTGLVQKVTTSGNNCFS